MLLNFAGHPEDQYMSVVWSGGLPDGAAEDKKNQGIWAHTDATEPGQYIDCFHKAGFYVLFWSESYEARCGMLGSRVPAWWASR